MQGLPKIVLIYLPEIGASSQACPAGAPSMPHLAARRLVEREADSPALPPVPAGQGVLRASSLEFRVPPLQLFPVRDRAAHLVFPSVVQALGLGLQIRAARRSAQDERPFEPRARGWCFWT